MSRDKDFEALLDCLDPSLGSYYDFRKSNERRIMAKKVTLLIVFTLLAFLVLNAM
jgi:hypothetical protein